MMSSDQIQHTKERLLSEKTRIERDLGTFSDKDAHGEGAYAAQWTDYGTSEEDSATEVADYTANLSLEKNLEVQLDEINAALSRIEEGGYGMCARCGIAIDPKRLEIRPASVLCVQCSSLQ